MRAETPVYFAHMLLFSGVSSSGLQIINYLSLFRFFVINIL